MPDLLLELRSEEIPARMQRKAAGDLKKLVTDALVERGLTYEGAREYWTPRRLTLDIRGLNARSADVREEKKGPRTDANEKAIEGFLRGAGLNDISEAQVVSDPKKGDFYIAIINKPGRPAEEIIRGSDARHHPFLPLAEIHALRPRFDAERLQLCRYRRQRFGKPALGAAAAIHCLPVRPRTR